MSASTYRYQLRPYTGLASRGTCPECGQRRVLVPYVDTRTQELLPTEYGRCNREATCGYHRSPYHIEADGLSYKERLYQQERTAVGGVVTQPPTRGRTATGLLPDRPPLATLPAELLERSMSQYGRNRLARLLQQHFGESVAKDLLLRFQIGTSAHWKGACVFWLVDELQLKIRRA